MQIKIIAVGKLKEKYWREAVLEYLKRLTAMAKVEVIEVSEEKIADNPSKAEIEQAKEKEGDRILKILPPSFFLIPLVIEGKNLSSQDFSQYLGKLSLDGKSQIAFVIGGSYGLSPQVINKGDFLLSFSSMTFPHQMMRVILLEQIYRSLKILKGEPYHK